MSPPPEPGHRPAIPAIAFLLVGLLVGEEAGRPPDVSDAARTGRPPVPTFGFRSVPGILEAGDGWPRDALHLVATGPLRGSGAEGVPDFLKDRITLNLELVGRFGGSLPKDIFAFGTNARVTLPDSIGIDVQVLSIEGMMFGWVQHRGSWMVILDQLPPEEVVIPRLEMVVEVHPILGEAAMRFPVDRTEPLAVVFLDRTLFLAVDGDSLTFGTEKHGRYGKVPESESRVHGLLRGWSLLDARGREIRCLRSMGRSWGWTGWVDPRDLLPDGGGPASLPLEAVARVQVCGPSATCRFVLKNLVIPAK